MTTSIHSVRMAMGLCLIGVVAACGGSSGSPVAQATPSSTASASPSPSASPSQVKLIPRMTGTGTLQAFRQQGFTCNQLQPPQPGWNQYDCVMTSADSKQQETVDTMGPGDQVANLEADTLGMSSADAAAFLGGVGSMPFTGSQAAQAQQWVATSVTKPDSMTDIGGVHFELVVGSTANIVRLLLNNS